MLITRAKTTVRCPRIIRLRQPYCDGKALKQRAVAYWTIFSCPALAMVCMCAVYDFPMALQWSFLSKVTYCTHVCASSCLSSALNLFLNSCCTACISLVCSGCLCVSIYDGVRSDACVAIGTAQYRFSFEPTLTSIVSTSYRHESVEYRYASTRDRFCIDMSRHNIDPCRFDIDMDRYNNDSASTYSTPIRCCADLSPMQVHTLSIFMHSPCYVDPPSTFSTLSNT